MGLGLDARYAEALAIADPVERVERMEELLAYFERQVKLDKARAVRAVARMYPRDNFGPKHGRDLNYKAAGRRWGHSGDWAKTQIDRADAADAEQDAVSA